MRRKRVVSIFLTVISIYLPWMLIMPVYGDKLTDSLPSMPVYGNKPTDSLPSWRNTAPKKAIIKFVEAVSTEGSVDFVPKQYRIATFDMDGTILIEKPNPVLSVLSLDFLKMIAKQSKTLRNVQPYKAAYQDDTSYIAANPLQVVLTAFMGYSQDEYLTNAEKFVKNAIHPRFEVPYFDLFYIPMLELIEYLNSHDFRVYIVSGSWQGFIRSVVKSKVELANSNLIGTQIKLAYQSFNGKTAFSRQGVYIAPYVVHNGKPEIIRLKIGEPPILAFGNSSGDQQMFEYTAANNKFRNLVLCLEHDDPIREYKYKNDVIYQTGWLPISMKNDFSIVFANKKISAEGETRRTQFTSNEGHSLP